MQATIWIIAALAVAALVIGVVRAVRRGRPTYVQTVPATVSVAGPVVDVLESPRHAAEVHRREE